MQTAPPLSSQRQTASTQVRPPVRQDDFDSPLDLELEKQSQAKREMALLTPLMWQGQVLQPWSLMRHALYRRLMMHLAPIPAEHWGRDTEAHGPDAMLFLWLAHHSPEEILMRVSQPLVLWFQVFAWAEEHLPKSQWSEAIQLMLTTFELGKITEVRVREEAATQRGKPEGRRRTRTPRSSHSSPRTGTGNPKTSAGT